MSTNPNNAVGTNGAYGGRTSVDAFNDVLGVFEGRGVVSGFAISPDSGMTVSIGGNGVDRDVAVAEDNAGNKTTVNNISKAPISVTIAGAPANNARIDSIVAYVAKPAQGSASDVDNPSACGLIVVSGAVSASPSAPDNNDIRTAITADGVSGTNAYYVVLGNITVASGTTTITNNMISAGANVKITGSKIQDNTVTGTANVGFSGNLALDTVGTANLVNKAVSDSKMDWGSTVHIYTSPSDIFSSNITTQGDVFAWRVGKIFGIGRISFDTHNQTNAGTVVATLKSEFRPRGPLVPYLKSIGNVFGVFSGSILTNGDMIEFTGEASGIKTYWGSICWIVN